MDYAKSVNKVIGKPYDEMDCYQLCEFLYKDLFGVRFDLYEETQSMNPIEASNLVKKEMNGSNFYKVNKPDIGDIMVIRMRNVFGHLGFCLDRKFFIHSLAKRNVTMDRYSVWHHRIEGFYRWRGLDHIR